MNKTNDIPDSHPASQLHYSLDAIRVEVNGNPAYFLGLPLGEAVKIVRGQWNGPDHCGEIKELELEAPQPSALDTQVGGGHYKDHPIQHVEFCQRNKLNWCESAAIKYIVRHGSKNGVEDIDKAIHYLQLLKELEY